MILEHWIRFQGKATWQDISTGYYYPGRFCCYEFGDSEGLFSTIPAICTALLGMLTGQFISSDYLAEKPVRKVLYMIWLQ